MTLARAWPLRATIVVAGMALLLALMAPAHAQTQTQPSAQASAYGAEISGLVDLGPLPEPVTASAPDGAATDSFLQVPVEPLVLSATLKGDVAAEVEANLAATLQSVIEDAAEGSLPDSWHSRGHAITEDLAALFVSEEEPQLTADVVESEAVATCQDGQEVFATGSRVQNLTLAGQQLPLLDSVVELVVEGRPNEDVLGNLPVVGETLAGLGLEIEAWDTNWDGGDGITGDGNTVWVDALRVSVTEDSTLGGLVGAQDITVSHSEATVDCDGVTVGPEEQPLANVGKTISSETVAPGDEFTYTITVPNSTQPGSAGACTLENVSVTDDISGPAGSQITATSPSADNVDQENLTVTWNDVGPIEPGDSQQLTVTISVPDDASGAYEENVQVAADCDGQDVTGGGQFQGPTVAFVKDGADDGVETEPVSTDGAGDDLPDTGGGAVMVGIALLGAGALAAGGRRLLS